MTVREMQKLLIAITQKQSPITQHRNGNCLETVSANIVLHLILFSVALKTCTVPSSNPTPWSFKQGFVHNCIILEHVPMRSQILVSGLESDLKSQVPLCCKSDAFQSMWRKSFIKVCSAGSKASKSDKFSRATEVAHAAFLAEKTEGLLDVLLESQRLRIS